MSETQKLSVDINVLREMVRLAENRRTEELEMIEKVNKYNLAIIAFAGSFLSLLVSVGFEKYIVQVAGFFLILAISISLFTIRPMTLKGGTLTLDEDVRLAREGKLPPLCDYLIDTADLLDRANEKLGPLRRIKVKMTITSAVLLAISLLATYIFYGYA